MNPERGQRVYETFEAALRCDPAGCTALLDTLCGDDRELRAEVERLLADDERASRDRFLTDPAPPGQGDQGQRPGLLGLRGLDIHILCPHCRNAIELIGLTTADVVCPACGSTFRLERESTASWGLRGDQRKLGRFELIEAVGVGAFGTVYKARDPQLDRTVAIKVPRAGNLATDEDRDRFLREARSVAQLSHAGIVPVHEVGEHEGVPYLVSDFVGGLTLADFLTGRRPPPREAACLVAEVADALEYAHGRGVIHRDIKPSNVMIDDEGRPHLMDFGLAKREAGEVTMTLEGQVLGTPAYMSPEQAKGEGHQVDGRSDIYSLGVLLYELLTGELPFRGNTRMLLHQVLHDEPRPPRSLNDRVPRDLETVCLKAMAKEPNRRYATARDLADDLRRFSGGEPIRARPVGRIEKAWRWCRRNPSLAAASSLAVAALVAVAVVSLVFAVEQTKAKNQNKTLADNLESSLNKSEGLAGELKTSLKESERRLAVLNFERGQAACEKGEIGSGLLRLVESWRSAVAADDPGWQHTARASVSAWQGHLARVRALFSHAGLVTCVNFSPDGKTVLTGSQDNTARLWDASTGQPLRPPMTHQGMVSAVAFSPDGKTVLTGSQDKTARLWDASTGVPLGPPMTHQGWVWAVAFSPDGKTVLTGSDDKTARLWDVSELPDNQERISTWAEVITGLGLDESGSAKVLNYTTWHERREKLEALGGQPRAGPRWSLDPILFGPDPTARAKAWMERKRWAEAEAAFDEAVVVRPLDTAILLERARFLAAHSQGRKADDDFARAYILGNRQPALLDTIHSSESLFRRVVAESAGSAAPLWASRGESLAKRQLWTEAAADCGEALRLEPENLAYRRHQILALLAAGDHYGLRRTRTDMLDRFGMLTVPIIANSVAWSSVMAVSEEPNLSETVRLAEFAVNGTPGRQKAGCLNTLGAALYRAGRFADAVRRLDEGIRYNRGVSDEADWVFLAMAHHRLGHHDEARRWLDRFRDRSPRRAPGDFWTGLEIRLLRTEAEAVVLWDPIFPADPFAS